MINTPSQDEFYQQLHQLLPPGSIWPPANESAVLNTLIEAFAESLRDMNLEASDEVDDVFPDSNGSYLVDWERVLALQKSYYEFAYSEVGVDDIGDPFATVDIITQAASTTAARVQMVLAFLTASRYNNDAFYEDLAALLGFTVTVTTDSPCRWTIDVTAGDTANIDSLIALANFYKPVHTELTVTY